MHIEFETNQVIDEDFPNKKPEAKEGARWFVRKQAALLWKDNSKYPDKFHLNLKFTDNLTDQQSVSGFAAGKYELSDDAFIFNARNQLIIDSTKLQPVSAMKMSCVTDSPANTKLVTGDEIEAAISAGTN